MGNQTKTIISTPCSKEDQEKISLLKRILKQKGNLWELRKELLPFFSSHPAGEKMLWYDLALLREVGPIGPLCKKEPLSFFGHKEKKLIERILKLIKKLPIETLPDFRDMVCFVSQFIERMNYFCNMFIYQFLEREKGPFRESCDISVYAEYFANKLFIETEIIYEFRFEKSMSDLRSKYEQWICEKALDEEVLV